MFSYVAQLPALQNLLTTASMQHSTDVIEQEALQKKPKYVRNPALTLLGGSLCGTKNTQDWARATSKERC